MINLGPKDFPRIGAIMNIRVITPEILLAALNQGQHLTLVDVRLADDHAAAHLPGAVNNCVYEVVFGQRMQEISPDREAVVCVYGQHEKSYESRMAAEKLEREGYTAIWDLRAGLDGWRLAEYDLVEGGPLPTDPAWPVGRHHLDLAECKVSWLGRNLLNSHWGTVAIKEGYLDCTLDGLSGGEVVLDMTALKCDDLAGHDMHDILIAHLQNDDFFDVERYPEARLSIVEGRWVQGAAPGSPNLAVAARLTLKDITADLNFTTTAGISPDNKIGAQATITLDRTRWNVLYGSGSLFARLGGHLVNDDIELRVRLVLAW